MAESGLTEPDIHRSILVVVADVNPTQKVFSDNPSFITHSLQAVTAFANTHLLLSSQNSLAVIACHSTKSAFVYPPEEDDDTIRQQDGQYELFTSVEASINAGVQKLIVENGNQLADGICCDSLLAGAIALALCYINRKKNEMPPNHKVNSRVLVVTGSGDSVVQYMNYMNSFFTAQKQNVVIDACLLDQECGLLQQGADITGGICLKIPNLKGLLEYLFWVFLPAPPLRPKLLLPPPVKVDYRAACFCHRELIEIGFVCSVCLSIFCKFSPICTTCHTVFKALGHLPMAKPKKKKTKLI